MKTTAFLLLLSFTMLSFYPPKKPAVFTMKKFEKKMAEVKPGLYACKFEATNLEYNEYLNDALKSGDAELYEKVRIKNENWGQLGKQYTPFIESYHASPDNAGYPVVNVPHEGAALFCEWLTVQYNNYPKRKFKKVKFKLPTEDEWLTAAKASSGDAIYPWGTWYVRDRNGQMLANFRRIHEATHKRIVDKNMLELGDLPVPEEVKINSTRVNTLAPGYVFIQNDLGMANISGNAAEMLAEPGHTKGGSWRSMAYYIRLDVEDELAGFTEPSPMIGFRYFMEVLEE